MAGTEAEIGKSTGEGASPAYRPRSIGMQFSAGDALVLVIAALAIWMLWTPAQEFALLVGFVVAHFFLFCNIFRIHRKHELAWAAVFVLNVFSGLAMEAWGLVEAMLWQVPLTVALIVAEMCSSRYHGAGCRVINARQVAEWMKT